MKKVRRLLIIFCLLSLILVGNSASRAESTQPKQIKCYHYNCWTYEFSGFTVCDWEVEDCDGRAAEFPAVS